MHYRPNSSNKGGNAPSDGAFIWHNAGSRSRGAILNVGERGMDMTIKLIGEQQLGSAQQKSFQGFRTLELSVNPKELSLNNALPVH
jgi:hypothetical protein